MQLSKKEEPVNFEQLVRKLQEAPFNSKEGNELLIKLMTEPKSKLSTEEVKTYGELQAYLLNDDLELGRLTYIAICLAVLRGKMYDVAKQISQVIQQQQTELSIRLQPERGIDLIGWQAACNTLQASNITSLNLDRNHLKQLNHEQWQAFCNALQTSKVTTLNLGDNYLGELDHAQWQTFCIALQNSNITSLNLSKNMLDRLDQVRGQVFCNALQASKITSLDLSLNNLGLLDQTQWQALCNALQTSNITSLNLSYNNLSQLDQVRWQAFCNTLQSSKITSLELSRNNLGEFDAVQWQTFCDALQASNITSLDLGSLNPNQMPGLVALMSDNFHLVLRGRMFHWPPKLIELNNRNRFLQETSKAAQELINTKSKQNEKDQVHLNITLTDLDKSLSILHGKDSPRNNALRAKLQNHLEDLQWKKAVWCREQAFVNKDAPLETHNLLNQARKVWLSISSNSKYFEEARHQLFQLVYNNVVQDPKANTHEAFIEALPYLVNEENQLINLSKENQKVFDNYLFAAAGGKEAGLDKVFAPEQRLALLQYILLLEIKQNCEQKDDTGKADTTQFFKTERLAGLLNSLKDLSLDPKNLDEDAQDNLNDLWVKTYDRLQKMPLSDNNTNLLIEAINHLKFPTPKLDSKPGV